VSHKFLSFLSPIATVIVGNLKRAWHAAMYSIEPFKILAATLLASCLVEFLSWAVVYRRSAFRHVKNDALTVQVKLDTLKAAGKGESDKGVKRQQETLTKLGAQLQAFRMQTMVHRF
jgi:hypothetical protein